MTDQNEREQRGLSIFDHGDEAKPSSAHDQTQVMSSLPPAGQGQSQPPGAGRPPLPPGFPSVRRGGYDKAAVDQYVSQFHAGQSEASQAARRAEENNQRLTKRVAELEQQLSEQANPTYSGLGAHAAAMLRLAEEQAEQVRLEAQKSAEQSRVHIVREAEALAR